MINTYCNPSRLIINKGKKISQEETTLGDHLAMLFYALITWLIQNSPRSIFSIKQVWLTEAMVGYCNSRREKKWLLHKWIKILDYIKNNYKLEETKKMFDSTFKYTTSGKRHLRASNGSTDFRLEYITEKINPWSDGAMRWNYWLLRWLWFWSPLTLILILSDVI